MRLSKIQLLKLEVALQQAQSVVDEQKKKPLKGKELLRLKIIEQSVINLENAINLV